MADLDLRGFPEPPLTDDELAEIQTRIDATAPGPWVHEEAHGDHRVGPEDRSTWVAYTGNDHDGDGPEAAMDAEFIAHVRTDVPRLIASLTGAREDNATLRAEVERLQGQLDQAQITIRAFVGQPGDRRG